MNDEKQKPIKPMRRHICPAVGTIADGREVLMLASGKSYLRQADGSLRRVQVSVKREEITENEKQ